MTRVEMLLAQFAEELCETAQRATKAMRFTLNEVEPGQALGNVRRMVIEFEEAVEVLRMLKEAAIASGQPWDAPGIFELARVGMEKRERVERFLEKSRQLGALE
jgi:hypothetical protein